MPEATSLTIYGAHWCPDCRRSKQFLGEYQIPYNWVNIEEDKAGEQYVLRKNRGKRIIPTLEFPDGAILVEPSNAELAAKLGLKTVAKRSHYDLLIAGGGPAGLSAGIYSAREGIDTLVLERAALGGQAATTQWLDNVPGFVDGIDGTGYADRLRRHAERFGVETLQAQEVIRVHSHDNYHCVRTADGSEYSGKALLLVTGSRYRRLNVPGEDTYLGSGVHYCATCDGPFYKGMPVTVVGGGNSATEESLFLLRYVAHVTLLVRGEKLAASPIITEKILSRPKVTVRFHTEATEFQGSGGKMTSVIIRDTQTNKSEEIKPAGVFVFVGQVPNTVFLEGSGVRINKWGYIVTGHGLIHDGDRPPAYRERYPGFSETSVPGIFAAGDVRAGSTKQVASAAGEGASAALQIRDYLQRV